MFQRFFKAVVALSARKEAPVIAAFGAGVGLSGIYHTLGVGKTAAMPYTKPITYVSDPQSVSDLAPLFKRFIKNHLVNGPDESLPYWGGFKDDKSFDADLVIALALQAQKTLGREIIEKDYVQTDLFYCPVGDRKYRRTLDELREIDRILKFINDRHLISPDMRAAILRGPKELFLSAIINPLYDIYHISEEMHLIPDAILKGVPVTHWGEITDALYEMQKAKVAITPGILLTIQAHPQCAESIVEGVIYISNWKPYVKGGEAVHSLINTVLKALIEHPEPNNANYLNGVYRNQLVYDLELLYRANVLTHDMANAIKTAVEKDPVQAGRIMFALRMAQTNGNLTEDVQFAIIENPCDLLGQESVHKVAFGTVMHPLVASETKRMGPLM